VSKWIFISELLFNIPVVILSLFKKKRRIHSVVTLLSITISN